ncbi:MAG: sigma-70 family RNA polymerase sigma factor [Verrucomicrobiota bacterium]|nr:sigma-70 family RNA polymerase sigma factor [Verrucomicrobiota bacterium]
MRYYRFASPRDIEAPQQMPGFSFLSINHSVGGLAGYPKRASHNRFEGVSTDFGGAGKMSAGHRLLDDADASKEARAEPDKALLLACRSGEHAAFAALYSRFAPPLFSAVFAIVKNQKDAEDVLQEAFVQMWKKAAAYDPQRGSVFTWSVMIARNKAIDRVRSQQRRSRMTEAATLESQTAFPDSPKAADELHGDRDERERVRAALSQISDAQRTAIDLAFFSGLTQSEIAAKLGAPLGTVKAWIRRGLMALRDELAEA